MGFVAALASGEVLPITCRGDSPGPLADARLGCDERVGDDDGALRNVALRGGDDVQLVRLDFQHATLIMRLPWKELHH